MGTAVRVGAEVVLLLAEDVGVEEEEDVVLPECAALMMSLARSASPYMTDMR